jgi:IclR family transcriptional regulator, acetate operon repressor
MGRRRDFTSESVNPYSIRAVERVCDLLDLLQQTPDGVSLMTAAEVTSLPKSSAFRYLATLEARRYAERIPANGDYRLGSAFLPMQAHQLDTLVRRAHPYLEELCDRFEETVTLGVLEGHQVMFLDLVESPRAVRVAARRGDRYPLHSSAVGKAIAATLPEHRVRAVLVAEGMQRLTENTITNPDAYLAELVRVRTFGYALDDGEHEPDERGIAAPLPGSNLPAALGVSAPASRLPLDSVKSMVKPLLEVATQLVHDLGGDA